MDKPTDFYTGKPLTTLEEVKANAEALNGFDFETIINWNWIFFPNKENAEEFINYLDSINWEHRGINNPSTTNSKLAKGYGVRFRGRW